MNRDDEDIVVGKSKSQVKRELKALQELGRELVALPAAGLERIPLNDSVRDAVNEARQLKREALRRQLQRVGKLLRDDDEPAIRQALEQVYRPHREEVRALHQVEQWRDQLLEGDDALLEEIVQRYAGAERQHLRQLVRNATREREREQPPKSARQLFRYLSELYAEDAD